MSEKKRTAEPAGDGVRRYRHSSDVELAAALRFCLEASDYRPEDLDERLGVDPGTVAAIAAGRAEPTGPVLRQLCGLLDIPRWLLYLKGAVLAGARAGYQELEEIRQEGACLLEKGDRQQLIDLVLEAVEVLLAIGGRRGVNGNGEC